MRYKEKDYQELINQLFEKHKSVQTDGFSHNAYKPGLERMRIFDKFLGHPSISFCSVHVAGTNGKGSVSHMLAAALSSKSRVGLYTSPHLVDFRERIRCVGPKSCSFISKEDVSRFLSEFSVTIDSLDLSFFEITTGMAFWWFAKQKIDLAIIEVGLGGREDSTNIIIPELSIITSIGLDHCAILGNTRAEIASEKAGIFKSGVPALVASRDEETSPVFEKIAIKTSSYLHYATDCPLPETLPQLDLRGEYQSANLHTVFAALNILKKPFDVSRISRTAELTLLRGRWECLSKSPYVICDIGHNPPALKWNFLQLKNLLSSGEYDRLIIIYGIMADKALDDIIPLMPLEAEFIFCAPQTSRALPAEMIMRRCGFGYCASSVEDAINQALEKATEKSIIYIGGSTFVVADAIKTEKFSRNNLQIKK